MLSPAGGGAIGIGGIGIEFFFAIASVVVDCYVL
jgi:hypothetical protein